MALFMIFYKRKQGGVGVYDLLKYPIIYIDLLSFMIKSYSYRVPCFGDMSKILEETNNITDS